MDLDRFVSQHWMEWARLDALVDRGRRSVGKLDDDELNELLHLYQRAGGHLSVARTQFDDPALTARLSRTLSGARGLIYRTRVRPGGGIGRFFTETFPAAVFATRRWIAVAAFLLLSPALALGFWMTANGDARNTAIDPETQDLIAEEEFAGYYSSEPAQAWTFELMTNNIQVAVMAFGLGALGLVGGGAILIYNGANVGVMAAVMHTHDRGAEFWGLILPHGLLELTAVCVASGAGLHLAWSAIAPGSRTRIQALAQEGQRTGTVVLGSMMFFVVAGLIEAFVTPSGLPTAARVGMGVTVELLALVWMFGWGRSVAARGVSGRMGETMSTVGLAARRPGAGT